MTMKPHRLRSILAGALFALVLGYAAGFWGVVLLIRSEGESLRIAGLSINHVAYDPVIQASRPDGVVRRMAADRFRWLCQGHEHRCVVSEKAPYAGAARA